VVTRLYKNMGLCFLCCVVRAEEISNSQIPKQVAIGVQKNTRSTTGSTRMRIESVVGSRQPKKLVVEELEVSL
jgi:hypothetical protein